MLLGIYFIEFCIFSEFISNVRVYGDESIRLFYFNRQCATDKLQLKSDNFPELIQNGKPIKFLIHGWGESSDRAYMHQMTQEYLVQSDVQVVQVDWSVLGSRPYVQAAENTKNVGIYLADFIIKLQEASTNEIFPLMHLIGHSLGAHAAGHVGKILKQQSGQLPGRITGLDPAGPYFDLVISERLTLNDAVFVDITHTDSNYFGLEEATGHVDFYPNGGHRPQPGCEPFNIELLQLNPSLIGFCSHIKSYMYFIASINNETDKATKCDSYEDFKRNNCGSNQQIIYGDHVNTGSRGKYYFDTGHQLHLFEPFQARPLIFNTNFTPGIVQNLLKIVQ